METLANYKCYDPILNTDKRPLKSGNNRFLYIEKQQNVPPELKLNSLIKGDVVFKENKYLPSPFVLKQRFKDNGKLFNTYINGFSPLDDIKDDTTVEDEYIITQRQDVENRKNLRRMQLEDTNKKSKNKTDKKSDELSRETNKRKFMAQRHKQQFKQTDKKLNMLKMFKNIEISRVST